MILVLVEPLRWGIGFGLPIDNASWMGYLDEKLLVFGQDGADQCLLRIQIRWFHSDTPHA